ncbi:EAL domain-containing protein [Thiorhodovibrio frisius]|uniref:PAS domain S-box/diguanylate cyclase (GGDEF) domain-containing protein n=1 Tax=Thiorhodovibrio frisius TaxID=631362 RepID=H8Z8I4_9GAMM|nr:EAL domain-containing protein [Thiorhodovibrio frisius]EIC19389.1 PAS domain S-box/diguanylate cyclase (GGDEF) domain-containing protein [Thiorhodovibrio frisius]WPL22311.1 Cyclic di-GMP phosphodiesterase Gmr [Thiorhodovibrio frisius]
MSSWSVSGKVAMLFAILLALTALMIGFTAWQTASVNAIFQRSGDVHRLLAQLRTLQATKPHDVALSATEAEHYQALLAELGQSLQAVEAFAADVSPDLQGGLARFYSRLSHYGNAFTETLTRYRTDAAYARDQLFAEPPAAATPAEGQLVEGLILHLAEFYLQRDLTTLDQARTDLAHLTDARLREQMAARIDAAEANYIAWLGILEHKEFLDSGLVWLIDLGERLLADLDTHSYKLYPHLLRGQMLWLLAFGLAVALMGFAAVRYARRFLAAQTHAVTAIEQGRFDYEPLPLPDDELGRLGQFLKRVALGLRDSRKQLEERDALLRKLSSNVPGFIYQFQLHPDGHFSFPYASDGIERIYGVLPEQVLETAQPVLDVIHTGDIDRLIAGIQDSARDLSFWQDRYRVQIPGRALGWRDAQAKPERLADGSVLWHGYIWDSSERVGAEERQRLAGRVFASAREGILITDCRGRVVSLNPTFTELTGWRESQMSRRGLRRLKTDRHPRTLYRSLHRSLTSKGHWKGELWVARDRREPFPALVAASEVRDDDDAVTHYVFLFDDISHIKEQQRRLEYLAHHDAVTQLPNRVLFADRLEQAMARTRRNGGLLLVAYLDLDEFKQVNDSRGDKIGDCLLVEVARRLASLVRDDDTVARIGGDEFALVLNEQDDINACRECMSRLREALARPYLSSDAKAVHISASIGGTLFRGEPVTGDELVRQADQAMYRAKELGRNRVELFEHGRVRAHSDRENSLTRIERALDQQEFVLYYQPKVDMHVGRVVGVEALIRWQHPQRGLVPPGDFLPVIEGSEFTVPLGDWVLESALKQLETWHAAGLHLGVSVNISPTHLQAPGFAEHLGEHLARHARIPPQCLELEILESTALDDVGYVSAVITDCHDYGVRFALDDFGTGFSSLAYLKGVPADVLKIDQSFVRDMLTDRSDLAIVEAVISLGRSFGKQVIAEGVETPEHGLALLHAGCQLAQGYGIARPMPAAAVADWVARFQPDARWLEAVADHLEHGDRPPRAA